MPTWATACRPDRFWSNSNNYEWRFIQCSWFSVRGPRSHCGASGRTGCAGEAVWTAGFPGDPSRGSVRRRPGARGAAAGGRWPQPGSTAGAAEPRFACAEADGQERRTRGAGPRGLSRRQRPSCVSIYEGGRLSVDRQSAAPGIARHHRVFRASEIAGRVDRDRGGPRGMSQVLTLEEFPPISTEQWEEVVRKDLKGAAPKTRLYYRAEDLRGLEYLDSGPGEFPYTRGTRGDNAWRIRAVVHDAAAAKAVLDAGADEICFVLGQQNIDEGLDALPPCAVHFEAGDRAAEVLEKLAGGRALAGAGVHPRSIDYEPLTDFDRAAHLVGQSHALPQFRPIAIRAHRFSEGGSTIVQELGFALAR